ncbi:MAG: acyltransferase family protein, partial [Chthoniobacterales bacterium]
AIIAPQMEAGNFSLGRYFMRRVRRLYPASALAVAATAIGAWLLLTPADLSGFGRSLFAQAALLANVYFYKDSGYFSAASETKPLLHLWSLAVEEQFYLLYPPLLLLLFKLKRTLLFATISAVTVASFAACVFMTATNQSAAFYLLPFRAWELSVGGVVYFLARNARLPRSINELAALAGLAAIVAPMFFFTKQTFFPGAAAALPVAGAAACLFSGAHQQTMVGRILALKPLVVTGLMSYSLYLWHWPLIVLNNYSYWGDGKYFGDGAIFGLTFAASFLSWKFVEQPVRQRTILATEKSLLAFFLSASLIFAASGLVMYWQKGLSWRFEPQLARYLDAEMDRVAANDFDTSFEQARSGDFKQVADGNAAPPLFVLGDSHARSLVPALETMDRPVYLGSLSSGAPILGMSRQSDEFFESAVKFMKSRGIGNVLLVSKWSWALADEKNFRGLQDSIARLRAEGFRVQVLGQPPIHDFDVPKFLAGRAVKGNKDTSVATDAASQYPDYNITQERLSAMLGDMVVQFIDLRPLFVTGDRLMIAHEGRALYYDKHHLSGAGAKYVAQLLKTESMQK